MQMFPQLNVGMSRSLSTSNLLQGFPACYITEICLQLNYVWPEIADALFDPVRTEIPRIFIDSCHF